MDSGLSSYIVARSSYSEDWRQPLLIWHNEGSGFAFAAKPHKAQDSIEFGVFKAVCPSAKKSSPQTSGVNSHGLQASLCSGLFPRALKREMELFSGR